MYTKRVYIPLCGFILYANRSNILFDPIQVECILFRLSLSFPFKLLFPLRFLHFASDSSLLKKYFTLRRLAIHSKPIFTL